MKREFFLGRFSKNTQISNLMKVRPVRTELFHADRRTDGRAGGRADMTNLVVTCRNLSNAPKNFLFDQDVDFLY